MHARGPSERVKPGRGRGYKPIALKMRSAYEPHREFAFAVPGEAEAPGHALTLPEDAVRGPHHRGPRPRGLPRHQ